MYNGHAIADWRRKAHRENHALEQLRRSITGLTEREVNLCHPLAHGADLLHDGAVVAYLGWAAAYDDESVGLLRSPFQLLHAVFKVHWIQLGRCEIAPVSAVELMPSNNAVYSCRAPVSCTSHAS